MSKIGNVLLPAEASLEMLRVAYALQAKFELRFCDFVFVYPNRRFSLKREDVIVGLNISSEFPVKRFNTLAEVITEYGNIPEAKYLHLVPDEVLAGFRGKDKTAVLMSVFAFFRDFSMSMAEAQSVPALLSACTVDDVCGMKVVTAPQFLSPEDRIVLFQAGHDYVVFQTDGAVGVQRSLLSSAPSLRGIKPLLPTRDKWFAHSRGHMLLSTGRKPPLTIDELRLALVSYIQKQHSARIGAE